MPQPTAPLSMQTSAKIPPEIVAVIAAAVEVTLGSRYRVVYFKMNNSHWEMAGRQAILSSHRIR